MDIKELYAQYGELLIQQEVLSSRITNVKQAIVSVLNNPSEVPATTSTKKDKANV